MRGIGILVVVACGSPPHGAADAGDAEGAGDASTIVSCHGLPSNCGPDASRSCCESRMVSGGTFYRSNDGTTDFNDTTHPATLSSFRLDTYEITVGRFRQFVNAGMGTQQNPPAAGAGAHLHIPNSGWDPTWDGSLPAMTADVLNAIHCDNTYQTWTDAPGGNETRPIGCISWYQAFAFCAWDGGFLPTEAELMYAAGGGSLQRAFPWSSPHDDLTIDCARADFGGPNWPPTACVPAGANTVGATSPVGDGVWGHADLAGNVWEWALDWSAQFANPCTDCADLGPAQERVIHGGAYTANAADLRAPNRASARPDTRVPDLGVRCARP